MPALPNFMVAGAGKAGTSWLYVCLREHPDVYVPPTTKELHFFSWNFDKGMQWYQSFYKDYRGESAVGDCSATYMHWDRVPERLYSYASDLKLVFVLRNPIERAYSQFCMLLSSGGATDNIRQALAPGGEIAYLGLYHFHLQRFLRYFPKRQIKLLFYDDLKVNPKAFLREAFGFLGVDDGFEPSVANKPYHVRKARKRFPRVHRTLARAVSFFMSRSRVLSEAYTRARITGSFDLYHRMMKGGRYPDIPDDLNAALADYYREDIGKLSEFCQRDLRSWLVR